MVRELKNLRRNEAIKAKKDKRAPGDTNQFYLIVKKHLFKITPFCQGFLKVDRQGPKPTLVLRKRVVWLGHG